MCKYIKKNLIDIVFFIIMTIHHVFLFWLYFEVVFKILKK